ncbi:hypothetical protein [Nocardia gipuzkoensis]
MPSNLHQVMARKAELRRHSLPPIREDTEPEQAEKVLLPRDIELVRNLGHRIEPLLTYFEQHADEIRENRRLLAELPFDIAAPIDFDERAMPRTSDIAVIGRLSGTEKLRGEPGYNVLWANDWSMFLNHRWVHEAIGTGQIVFVTSDPATQFFDTPFDESRPPETPWGRATVFYREFRKFEDSGYRYVEHEHRGFLIPPRPESYATDEPNPNSPTTSADLDAAMRAGNEHPANDYLWAHLPGFGTGPAWDLLS